MGIRLFTEKDREQWDRYVSGSGSASCYHLIGWKTVIERSYGHEAYYFLSEDEHKRINGILPLIHMKSSLFGNFMISLPYFNYGGICTDAETTAHRLLDEAIVVARRLKVSHIELRHSRNLTVGLPVKTHKVSMRLDLHPSSAELWESLPAKVRNQVRRPSREGMYAKIGGEDELDGFYRVFSRNMRDLGTPVYPKEFFSNILRSIPATRICTVYTGAGRPAAAGFLTGFQDRLEIPWASSLRTYNRFSPNMLLYWSVLKYACEQGYAVFDFGRSTPGEGTYKFKEQWGAKPNTLYWHYWMSAGNALPELNPRNPKYRAAISLWKRLPVGLTNLLGPALVKNIP